MARIYTTQISETECIGDSLDKINGNSLNLDTAIQGLSSNALNTTTLLQTTSSTLATSITNKQPLITANDTNTIDLTLTTGNSPVLTGSVKNDSIRYSNLTSWQSVSGTSLSAEAVQPRLAKAWVTFNGDPASPTIYDHYNISSVTKSSAGTYQINFITPLPSSNFSVAGLSQDLSNGSTTVNGFILMLDGISLPAKTTNYVRVRTWNAVSGAFTDATDISVLIYSL